MKRKPDIRPITWIAFVLSILAFALAVVTCAAAGDDNPALGSNPDSDESLVLDILRDFPGNGEGEEVDRWRIELLAPVSSRISVAAGFHHEDTTIKYPLQPYVQRSNYGLSLRVRIFIGGGP